MIPHKTSERLILYKYFLEKLKAEQKPNVYSKDLAEYSDNKAEQVRRDLMVVGCSGNSKNGYDVDELLDHINQLLKTDKGVKMTLVGVGNLGKAILGYFFLMQPKFLIECAFDNDENKVKRIISGCPCYHIAEMESILKGKNIDLGVITVPGNEAQKVAEALILSGVKGIVNFSPVPIKSSNGIFVENINMAMTFEKVAYFSKLIK